MAGWGSSLVFFFALVANTCDVLAYPNSGKFKVCKLSSNTISQCKGSLALYEGGMIFLQVNFGTLPKGLKNVSFTYDILRGSCAMKGFAATEVTLCSRNVDVSLKNQKANMTLVLTDSVNLMLSANICPFSVEGKNNTADHYIVRALQNEDLRNRSMAVIQVGESDIYTVLVKMSTRGKVNLTVDVFITMLNQHGYLDAADFPSMVFYALMFVVYIVLGLIWSVCMCCSCKDLIRLQLFIGVAIVMGFVETWFFVIEYGSVNTTGGTDGAVPLMFLTEGISAGRKMFFRVLLVMISSGYGTTKHRLGGLLRKLLVFGAIFFAVTFADGLARSWNKVTIKGSEQGMTITMIVQITLDTFCLFWILSKLTDTRMTLELKKNFKTLAIYNHFLVTFLFLAVGVLAFLLWILVTGIMDKCDEDWTALWLKECFWPLLFTILLVVVIVLWRPSSNAVRFAYSAVSNDDDEEIQQKEKLRMTHRGKVEVLQTKPYSQTHT